MNIVEIMQTANDEGLTLSEMRAKVRMKVALLAFSTKACTCEFDKVTVIESEIKDEPDIEKDFYNLLHKHE